MRMHAVAACMSVKAFPVLLASPPNRKQNGKGGVNAGAPANAVWCGQTLLRAAEKAGVITLGVDAGGCYAAGYSQPLLLCRPAHAQHIPS